jgi:nicotinamide-nucleotide amidase
MKAEILAIGTELLLGQIVNSNAQYLSQKLADLGIPVYYHTVVGDNTERLFHQLQVSSKRSDLIFLTGGLGPTKDDLTKETIAKFLNKKITLDQPSMQMIEQFFLSRGRVMTENNKRQAMVIEGAHVFSNKAGMAPGMAIKSESAHYLLFPGPPKELIPMFESEAIPYLQALLPERKVVFSKVMRFCGIGESSLEDQLQELIDKQTSPTLATYAKEGEVTLRITSWTNSAEEAEKEMASVIEEIQKRVGRYHYGWDDESLEQVIISLCRDQRITISVAESCTAGQIAYTLCQVPGASEAFAGGIVTYTNEMKEQQLGIPREVLQTQGAVSEMTAQLMEEQVVKRFGTDIGLSVTGVAGPSQQEGKPIGQVYVGFTAPKLGLISAVTCLQLHGTREIIQLRATKAALSFLLAQLKKVNK